MLQLPTNNTMLNLKEDSPRPKQMNLKQAIFTVGLLISFAAAGTKAQPGNSDTPAYARSLSTSMTKDVGETLTVPAYPTSTLSPMDPALRYCNLTYNRNHTYETTCSHCDKDQYKPCPADSQIIKLSCQTDVCRTICLERIVDPRCCHGYYGADCTNIHHRTNREIFSHLPRNPLELNQTHKEEIRKYIFSILERVRQTEKVCPGGTNNPCNGHGTCLDLKGSCVCETEFKGEACELCRNDTKYGPNCSQDCTCMTGPCNNGIFGDGGCAPDNPCNKSDSLCGATSQCLHTGPSTYECVCNEGYRNLGNVCIPIDPCSVNNGGCDITQDCISQGSSQVKCQCKVGYKEHSDGKNCKLKDMCSPGLCGRFAYCETKEPLKHRCVCHGSYSWTGEACSGNIIERLKELSIQDVKFKDNIWYMRNITSKVYDKLLTIHGPFTIFVPTDQAFRNAFNKTELDKLMNDDRKMKQILRQHILPAKFKTSDFKEFQNLQGNMVNFESVEEEDIYWECFQLTYGSAHTERSKIVAKDVEASNGVIHLISDVMGLKDNQFEDSKETVMDLIKNQPDYSTMYSMIRAASLSEMFSQPNTTVLITDNKAWARFSLFDRNYLATDQDGLAKLTVILKLHIFPGVIDVIDLINLQTIKSSADVQVKVQVSQQGQIELDTDVSITRANIPISSGLCHRVDRIMVPSYLTPLMTNNCEVPDTERVEGSCQKCGEDVSCPRDTDEPTGERKYCSGFSNYYETYDNGYRRNHFNSYNHKWHLPWQLSRRRIRRFVEMYYCSAICVRKTKRQTCCSGFYGPSCIPCPGGSTNPCNGNGQCSAGKEGTGQCSCNNNFAGTACNQCARDNTFGTSCENTCTCQFGQCVTGPKGTGKCKPGTCQLGYTGENCDNKLVPCESDADDLCQTGSACFLGEDGIDSCYCAPGYMNNEEDGVCVENDLCDDENNPCHHQATCLQTGPGVIICLCNTGWHGDGFYCMPNNLCFIDSHCHRKALCQKVVPGQYHCVCKTVYQGNGQVCELFDPCYEYNGGCHQKAQCTLIKKGERNCTCPERMIGDGVTCRGTIAEEVKIHPQLAKLRDLMEVVNPSNMILDMLNTTFTFFAPSDSALTSFFESTKTSATSDYWRQEENVLSFLNFHTLSYDFTTDDMLAFNGVIKRYPTLYDGFSLRIVNTNKSLHIFANHSKYAVIKEANIPAFNGYFHIIDQVLEPFLPDEEAPSLNDTLSLRPEYQLFYEALKETKLLEAVSTLNEFTLFVLSNENFKQIGRKPTASFLKYYIVPQLVFTPCISDAVDHVDTLLGLGYQLSLNQVADQVWVNQIRVIRSDILTDGGVIHELESAIHPILNHCDSTLNITNLGPCGDCTTGDLKCNAGFESLGPEHVIKYQCHFHKHADTDWESAGCQQICVRHKFHTHCCSGFYGYHCDECPGGTEISCSGNGVCSEGKNGSGRCQCNPGFAGTLCDRCESTDLVPPFCNITYDSCAYMNGNCSDLAWCNETESGIICQCFSGYVGDGHTCTHLCETGECHPWASCTLNVPLTQTFQCECKPGFHGNGTWCQQNSDPCTSQNGGCDLERAVCNFTQPKVTDMDEGEPVCECEPGYVGDGKLCSSDLLDAISRTPELSSFFVWLQSTERNGIGNITKLFCDRSKTRTVFASISKPISSASYAVVDGTFELPDYSNTEGEVKTNISNGNFTMDDIKVWTLKSLKGQVLDIIVTDQGEYLVNGVRIVRGNIQTLNGVLHMTEAPFASSDNVQSLKSTTTDKAKFNSKPLIAGVAAAVTVVLVALVAVIVYKKRHNLFKQPPPNSECYITYLKMNSGESGDTVSIPDNTQYHNPLFTNQNLQ